MAAERWILRCTHSLISDLPYEQDFKTESAAHQRATSLANDVDKGVCNGPHEIVKQEWQEGHWADISTEIFLADLTSEDKTGTMEP